MCTDAHEGSQIATAVSGLWTPTFGWARYTSTMRFGPEWVSADLK